VTGLELCSVDSNSSGLCPVDSKNLWLPHMISGNLGWVMVKSWVGLYRRGIISLWVGHGETP
jgi:hypothetical protein